MPKFIDLSYNVTFPFKKGYVECFFYTTFLGVKKSIIYYYNLEGVICEIYKDDLGVDFLVASGPLFSAEAPLAERSDVPLPEKWKVAPLFRDAQHEHKRVSFCTVFYK